MLYRNDVIERIGCDDCRNSFGARMPEPGTLILTFALLGAHGIPKNHSRSFAERQIVSLSVLNHCDLHVRSEHSSTSIPSNDCDWLTSEKAARMRQLT